MTVKRKAAVRPMLVSIAVPYAEPPTAPSARPQLLRLGVPEGDPVTVALRVPIPLRPAAALAGAALGARAGGVGHCPMPEPTAVCGSADPALEVRHERAACWI